MFSVGLQQHKLYDILCKEVNMIFESPTKVLLYCIITVVNLDKHTDLSM